MIDGIGSVTCSNRIDSTTHNVLWNAVQTAIADWDWHLSLLNAQYGVDWNVFSVGSTASATITVAEKPEGFGLLGTAETIMYAFTEDEGDRFLTNDVDPSQKDWKTVIVWVDIEEIDGLGYLNNATYLRRMMNHEFGHALGLNHYSDDEGVIMYDVIDNQTATVPTEADLAGIYYLYG